MKKTGPCKTNVIRLLQSAGISFTVKEYPVDEGDLSAVHAARFLDIPLERVFKTLVLRGDSGAHFVCCIPAAAEVDLKKAARAFGEKSARLIPVRELLPLTGYLRGGCSPLGMKKQFPLFIDGTAELFDSIGVSAGQRGVQVVLAPADLAGLTGARFSDLTGVTPSRRNPP
ncbi:MAG: Cys-tRNA(Pro) deacylase [Spirochaetaceae bacterium]|jgi:Cys-tRNA(Pro)/Cys-tRNA(Cys) deacylase|nr:Cys-tRNA(Pro) deacylase [Spirochaetaceae bacterium]